MQGKSWHNIHDWTKNAHIIEQTIDNGNAKPSNLIIVWSSFKLNEPADINKYWFVDKIFTVYTADVAIDNGTEINCGNKKCRECRLCYSFDNDIQYINEVLKQEQNRYYKEIENGKENG